MTDAAGRRLVGLTALVLGIGLVAIAQLATREAQPPLFDGVVPTEPYRWLEPPAGQPGGAEGATATIPVQGGQSDLVAVATTEIPPQAQIFASPGSLTLPPGATAVEVSIQPIPPPAASPPDGYIDGNLYRISVTDQSGTPLSAPASARVSLVLRSVESLASATIERFDGTTWTPIATSPAGTAAFLAVVTSFGDFAVVASGTSPYPTPTATSGPAGSAEATAEGSGPAPASGPVPSGAAPSGGAGGVGPTVFLVAAVVAAIVLAASILLAPARTTRRRTRGRTRGRR